MTIWAKSVLMKRCLLGSAVAGIAAFAAVAPTDVFAASTKSRVEVLEAEVAQLKAQAAAAAATAQRMERLEAEIRRLTGQVETLEFKLDQADDRIASLSAALAGEALPPRPGDPTGTNLSAVDGGYGAARGGPVALTAGPAPSPELAAAGAPAQPAPNVELPLDPEAAFTYANNLVLARDYPRAEAAFKLFRQTFRGHPRSADAQFRLGEIYLATERNAEAADAFIAHLKEFPNNARASEAYLKLGTSFARMGETEQACSVFKTMRSKYPNAPFDVTDRAAREMEAAGCR